LIVLIQGNAIRDMAMARTPYGSHQHRDGSVDGTSSTTGTESNLSALSPTILSNSSHPNSSSLQINNGHDLWKYALIQMGGEFTSFSHIIDYNRRDQVDDEHDGNSYHRGGKDKDTIDKDKDKESIDKVTKELYCFSWHSSHSLYMSLFFINNFSWYTLFLLNQTINQCLSDTILFHVYHHI